MSYRADIEKIERTFNINSKIDDTYSMLRADEELSNLRKSLSRRNRAAKVFQYFSETMIQRMRSFWKRGFAAS